MPIQKKLNISERDVLLKQQTHLNLIDSVITHVKDAIIITEAQPQADSGPKIIYVNPAFTQMTGYLPDEVIGKSRRILHGPKTDIIELEKLRESMAAWRPCETTILNYKKSGEEFWINVSISPVVDENGVFTHWISIERDVTESRKLENQYNQIFKQAPDVICTVGLDGYFRKVNPAFCILMEYSELELLAKPLVKLIHHDEQKRVMINLEKFNKGDKSFYFENRCITKSGKVKWLAWTSTPALDEGIIFTVAKDITYKKELEDLLHKATNLAGIGGWEFDNNAKTVYWSEMTKRIHEVDSAYQPSFTKALKFYKESTERRLVKQKIKHAIEKCISFDFETQIITAKGNVKWVRVIGEPEFTGEKCIRVRGSLQDIDLRKTSDLAIAVLLKEKKSILESIGDAFFAVDTDWRVTYWNHMAEKVFGKSRKVILGRIYWEVFPDSIGSHSYIQYHHAIKENIVIHFEDFYPALQRWYEISIYPSDNGLSVYLKDTTEKKATEILLVESERRYSELFQLSPLPKLVFDLDTLKFLDVNLSAIEHYGFSREEFLMMTIKDIRPVEDVGKLNVPLNSTPSDLNFVQQGVFTHRKKSGELIKVEIQSNSIKYKGKRAKIIVANDITENLAYIEAIELQNEKLRDISWMQSHVIRAPLARIMGLAELMRTVTSVKTREKMLDYLLQSANELDEVVKDITNKSKLK